METFAFRLVNWMLFVVMICFALLGTTSIELAFASPSGTMAGIANLDATQARQKTISEMEPFTLERALEAHPFLKDNQENKLAELAKSEKVIGPQAMKKVAYTEQEQDKTPLENEPEGSQNEMGKTSRKAASKKPSKTQQEQCFNASPELDKTLKAAAAEKQDQAGKREAYLNSEEGLREQLVEAAHSRLGVPYVYGGTDPENGMDCSGFTQWCYSQIGVSIARTSYDQEGGAAKLVSLEEAKPGDILCAGGHVALYIGDGQYIHEPQSGDVCRVASDMSQFHCAACYV